MNRRFIPALLGSTTLLWIALVGAAPQDPPQLNRIDPMLRISLERLEAQARSIHGIGELSPLARSAGVTQDPLKPDEPIFNVLVRGSGAEGAVTAAGGGIGTRLGPIVTARVPMSGVRSLASAPGVDYVEASVALYPQLDTSVPATGADLVHGGSYNLRGQGVLVAVYDSGLDYTHDDFRNGDGTSRVLYMWDQTITGTPPTSPPGCNYGAEWTKTQLDDELDGTPAGVVTETDSYGHGTHVMGIAAGNGRATGGGQPDSVYVGMAPAADLLVIKGGDDSFTSTRIIDGIAWSFDKAGQLSQPAVINLSLGGHSGPHDGTMLYEEAIDNAIGPGKVVVVAAGNEGDEGIHGRVQLTTGTPIDSISFIIPDYIPEAGTQNDYVFCNIWYDGSAGVATTVRDAYGALHGPIPDGAAPYGNDSSVGYVYINNASSGPDARNGDKQAIIQVYDYTEAWVPSSGTWTVIFDLMSGTSATVDLWIDETSNKVTAAVVGGTPDYSVAHPGTAIGAITVGSYVTKWSWTGGDGTPYQYTGTDRTGDYSLFTGWGPSRDGRPKPEISAPGQGIMSAMSSSMTPPVIALQNPDGVHRLSQGTSMSAPHVAGAVALLLQAQSYLTASQIKSHLTATAVKDSYTESLYPTPNYIWGHGKLDVKAAVDLALATGDTLAPTFTVGILRNSVLSDYLDLYFVPSEILDDTPTASVDATALTLSTVTTSEATLYVGDYTIPASGTYTISVYGSDLAGNDTTVTRQFTAQMITASEGGLLLAAGGALQATFTPYSLMRDEYIVARRLEEKDKYELLPHDKVLSREVRLVISYDPADLIGVDPSSLGMYRWENGEWRYVESYVDVARRQVEASIGKLGIYKLLSSDNNPAAPSFNYGLEQNYPNPFNVTTQIRYTLARQSRVELFILNTRGQRVRTLLDHVEAAGSHVAAWDGRNDAGRPVASGIYLVMLRANGQVFTRKALLLK